MTVENELKKLGYAPLSIELGEVVFKQDLSQKEVALLENALKKYSFEVITDKRSQVIEQIKTAAIAYVFENDDDTPKPNFSEFLEKKVLKDYTYLSNSFSEIVGTTIEKYLINLKIERVKELLVYDALNFQVYQVFFNRRTYYFREWIAQIRVVLQDFFL